MFLFFGGRRAQTAQNSIGDRWRGRDIRTRVGEEKIKKHERTLLLVCVTYPCFSRGIPFAGCTRPSRPPLRRSPGNRYCRACTRSLVEIGQSRIGLSAVRFRLERHNEHVVAPRDHHPPPPVTADVSTIFRENLHCGKANFARDDVASESPRVIIS